VRPPELGPQFEAAYDGGYADTVLKSAWASFKAKHKLPYTIGMAFAQPIKGVQGELIPLLEKERHAIPGVGKVVVLTSPPTGLTTQIQQVNRLIQEKVDVIAAAASSRGCDTGPTERCRTGGCLLASARVLWGGRVELDLVDGHVRAAGGRDGRGGCVVRAWTDFVTWAGTMSGSGTFRLVRDLDNRGRYMTFAPSESLEAQAVWKQFPESFEPSTDEFATELE